MSPSYCTGMLQPANSTILAPSATWRSYSGVRCSSGDTGTFPPRNAVAGGPQDARPPDSRAAGSYRVLVPGGNPPEGHGHGGDKMSGVGSGRGFAAVMLTDAPPARTSPEPQGRQMASNQPLVRQGLPLPLAG